MFKKTAIAASVIMMSITTAQAEDTYRIGITQNNVGVDSYQTTYESAFEAAAEEAGNVDIVVPVVMSLVRSGRCRISFNNELMPSLFGRPTGRRLFPLYAKHIMPAFRWSSLTLKLLKRG